MQIAKKKIYAFTCDTCNKHFNNRKDFNYHKKKNIIPTIHLRKQV